MKLVETAVAGAWRIELEPFADERGFFARTFCAKEFEEKGLAAEVVQANVSFNRRKGTLRGMHWQEAPKEEAKLVRCVRGAIFDVVAQLDGSAWEGVELTAENRTALYVPPGCAHGFQTLADDTEVVYQMSEFYSPEHARGRRYDDPAWGIEWPLPVSVISEKDLAWT